MPAAILSADAVSSSATGQEPFGLRSVSLAIPEGSLNLVSGRHGCGKDLLMRVLGLLQLPDKGDVSFRQAGTRNLSEQERAAIRNRRFGFHFAEPYLLPSFSVLENVAMPFLRISAVDTGKAQEQTRMLLDFVGVASRAQIPVAQLTRGEQHRVSLARALVNQPEILMVESVDSDMRAEDLAEFCAILRRAVREFSLTVILSASDCSLVPLPDNIFALEEGAIHLPIPARQEGARV